MVVSESTNIAKGLQSGEIDIVKNQLPSGGRLTQMGDEPLKNIDLAYAESSNVAQLKERKINKTEFELKKLFLRYIKKYKLKWRSLINYPKQIKQEPAWFHLGLSMFTEDQISSKNKKIIKDAFTALWDYRDSILPERVMTEEESLRQYGIHSPYYQAPEDISMEPINTLSMPSTTDELIAIGNEPQPEFSTPTTAQPIEYKPPEENTLGVRQIVPSSDDYLSQYVIPMRKTTITPSTVRSQPQPQGTFVMGVTQPQKNIGGSGGGAFSIGQNMLSGIRGGGTLKQVLTQNPPNLPQQPLQVVPDETITIAKQPQVMQRAQKSTASSLNRKTVDFKNMGLAKFRNIELPTIGSSKVVKKKKSGLSAIKSSGFELPNISPKSPTNKRSGFELPNMKLSLNAKSNKKSGLNVISKKRSGIKLSPVKIKSSIKLEKGSANNMSRDIRKSVGSVVGGINDLKKQVRGEFKSGSTLSSINIKNIKSNKNKGHKDLDVLKKLKMETHNQISREALECKMIPRLKEQCDKVFNRNHITNEVSKFRKDFKDISKMVPTVKGDKAKITEIAMLGNSIAHGVDGAHVADVRNMYKNSGATKQMNIGMMEYDYSFVTGKKKPKFVEEYEEE